MRRNHPKSGRSNHDCVDPTASGQRVALVGKELWGKTSKRQETCQENVDFFLIGRFLHCQGLCTNERTSITWMSEGSEVERSHC